MVNIWVVSAGVSYQLPIETLLGTSNQLLGMNTAADALQYKEVLYNNTSHQLIVPTTGGVAAPGYTFLGQLTSGFYWDAATSSLAAAVGAANVWLASASLFTFATNVKLNGKMLQESTAVTFAASATMDFTSLAGNVVTITNAAGTTVVTSLGGDTLPSGTEIETIWSIAGGSVTLTYDANKIVIPGGANLGLSDGDVTRWRKTNSASPYWRLVSYQRASISLSTRQVFTAAGAGTYVTPAGCKQLKIRMKGGGGGGAGTGTPTATAGATGTASSFNLITAAGGGAGSNDSASQTGTGAGVASLRISGVLGGNACFHMQSAAALYWAGGPGGGNGGGVIGGGGQAGGAAVANSGGGGGGAGTATGITYANSDQWWHGAGGSEGEEIEIIINNPTANYAYIVGAGGAGGAAGTSGFAGGAGGSGFICVDEFYG